MSRIGSSFRIPYHYRFSMGTFKERPIHLHNKWRKWWGILVLICEVGIVGSFENLKLVPVYSVQKMCLLFRTEKWTFKAVTWLSFYG